MEMVVTFHIFTNFGECWLHMGILVYRQLQVVPAREIYLVNSYRRTVEPMICYVFVQFKLIPAVYISSPEAYGCF